MKLFPRPLLLIVLDGWGYREETQYNAIAHAKKPIWNKIWEQHPHSLIRASAKAVGLPKRQMGNSEVGHLNLGAGRVVFQEFSRVAKMIESGEFYNNKVLLDTIRPAIDEGKAVHILGLLSQGGVHSHESHIQAMVELAARQGAEKIYLHAFLDGRDAPPKSAASSIEAMESLFRKLGKGRFASVIGRYYAMDRDNRWARTQAAYELLTDAASEFTATSAQSALAAAYERDETDEFVRPTAITDEKGNLIKIEDGDAVVIMNFRSDRARQITRPFIEPDFDQFPRTRQIKLGGFATLTRYHEGFANAIAYPPAELTNTFGAYISDLGLRQLRIAETEKYAHVTFFLNGGVEEPFPGEDRILIPSPHVATYDMQPEMNAPELTNRLVNAIESEKYDVIICNYANPDMVGHTGNFDATVEAIETLDICLGRVLEALDKVGGEALITADHGNAELMRSKETGQAHTAHTTNPVPFIYIGRPAILAATGALSDVTPTMLYLMGLDKPAEMTGTSLVELTQP